MLCFCYYDHHLCCILWTMEQLLARVAIGSSQTIGKGDETSCASQNKDQVCMHGQKRRLK